MEISPIDFWFYSLYFLFLHLYVVESRYEPWCFDQPKLRMCIHRYSADSDHGFYRAIVKEARIYPRTQLQVTISMKALLEQYYNAIEKFNKEERCFDFFQ